MSFASALHSAEPAEPEARLQSASIAPVETLDLADILRSPVWSASTASAPSSQDPESSSSSLHSLDSAGADNSQPVETYDTPATDVDLANSQFLASFDIEAFCNSLGFDLAQLPAPPISLDPSLLGGPSEAEQALLEAGRRLSFDSEEEDSDRDDQDLCTGELSDDPKQEYEDGDAESNDVDDVDDDDETVVGEETAYDRAIRLLLDTDEVRAGRAGLNEFITGSVSPLALPSPWNPDSPSSSTQGQDFDRCSPELPPPYSPPSTPESSPPPSPRRRRILVKFQKRRSWGVIFIRSPRPSSSSNSSSGSDTTSDEEDSEVAICEVQSSVAAEWPSPRLAGFSNRVHCFVEIPPLGAKYHSVPHLTLGPPLPSDVNVLDGDSQEQQQRRARDEDDEWRPPSSDEDAESVGSSDEDDASAGCSENEDIATVEHAVEDDGLCSGDERSCDGDDEDEDEDEQPAPSLLSIRNDTAQKECHRRDQERSERADDAEEASSDEKETQQARTSNGHGRRRSKHLLLSDTDTEIPAAEDVSEHCKRPESADKRKGKVERREARQVAALQSRAARARQRRRIPDSSSDEAADDGQRRTPTRSLEVAIDSSSPGAEPAPASDSSRSRPRPRPAQVERRTGRDDTDSDSDDDVVFVSMRKVTPPPPPPPPRVEKRRKKPRVDTAAHARFRSSEDEDGVGACASRARVSAKSKTGAKGQKSRGKGERKRERERENWHSFDRRLERALAEAGVVL